MNRKGMKENIMNSRKSMEKNIMGGKETRGKEWDTKY